MVSSDIERLFGFVERMRRPQGQLPPVGPIRWVVSRKIEVLYAIRKGLLSCDEACRRYGISMDELLSWQEAMTRFGPNGLRATRNYTGVPPLY
jgi:hypothetical protein